MSGLFSSPKTPAMPAAPAPAPAPPTINEAQMAQQQDSLLRSRRGAAASALAGADPAAPTSLGTPRLLGG
jgi:hypothetical protein